MIIKKTKRNITDEVKILESHNFIIDLPSDQESVVVSTRKIAQRIGLKTIIEYLVATSASELATNIYRYAGHGEMIISIISCSHGKGIEITAIDHGPGIRDIDQAMQDHFTTTERSLGMGLPSVLRIMDEFKICSNSKEGTQIITRKWGWT